MKKLMLSVLFAVLGFSSIAGPVAAKNPDFDFNRPPVLNTSPTNPPGVASYAVMLPCTPEVTGKEIALSSITIKNTTHVTLKAGTVLKYTLVPAIGPKVFQTFKLSANLAPNETIKFSVGAMKVKTCYASVTFKTK